MRTLKRSSRMQRNRRANNASRPPLKLTLVASTIEFSTPNVIITYPVPVVLKGIPQWLTNTSKLPTAATATAPNVVTLAYDAPGAVTDVTVPENDPAIRSATGGYAAPGTFPAT